MCKTWSRIRVRIWISIQMESRIQIRIGIDMLPIHNTLFNHTLFFSTGYLSKDTTKQTCNLYLIFN